MVRPLAVIAADLHLGGSVATRGGLDPSVATGARFQALERLVELCRREKPALVLLPGDVFHTPRPPLAAVLEFERALEAWREMGARVFIAPGNHDPWLSDCLWSRWSGREGLVIFEPRGHGLWLDDLGLWVAGVGHDGPEVAQDLSPRIPDPPAGATAIGVLHANLVGPGCPQGHQNYAPVAVEDLARRPFAWWALGHVHKPQVLRRSPLVFYPGTTQGAHLDEDGPRGVWLVDLATWQPRLVPLAPLTFHDLTFDHLLDVHTPSDLAQLVRERLPQPHARIKRCLRLSLEGPSPLWTLWRDPGDDSLGQALAKALGVEALELRREHLLPPLDLTRLAKRGDLLSKLWTRMDQLDESPQDLPSPSDTWHPQGRAEQDPDYRRELLGRVRDLLLNGLWQGPEA